MIVKNCDCCGKEFEARNCRQHYCSESCQKRHYNETNRASVIKEMQKKEKEKRISTQNDIVKIAAEARKCGMSYGKYLALLNDRCGKEVGW